MNSTNNNLNTSTRKQRLKELLDYGKCIGSSAEVEDNVQTIGKITEIMKETNLLNRQGDVKQRADNTTENVMDAQVVKMTHELIGQVMTKVASSAFSDDEYLNAIVELVYKNDTDNWDALANVAVKIAKTTKFSSCMVGAFEHEPVVVEKVNRRQRKAKELTQEQRPEAVNKLETQGKGVNKVNIVYKQIAKLYKENKFTAIPYYELIIDPDDFMNTVENAFQVSFLVQNNQISVEIGDDDLPSVRPITQKDRDDTQNENVQAICTLNKAICEKMIKKYKIRRPLLVLNPDELDRSQIPTHSRS